MEKVVLYLCVASSILGFVNPNRIITFPDHVFAEVGSSCSYYNGGKGSCMEAHKCPEINNLIRSRKIEFREVRCDLTAQGYTLVCCKLHSVTRGDLLDISAPENYDLGTCQVIVQFDDYEETYRGNETAEEFKREGFTIVPIDVVDDHLVKFEFFNSTDSFIHMEVEEFAVVAGIPARRILAAHMALLQGENDLLCGGVLISYDWILTAAHCFEYLDLQTTVVTLGEYDTNEYDYADSFGNSLKFSVKELIRYPQYRHPSSYHDLALIRINESAPAYRIDDIRPVCLPWGNEATKTHVGEEITLTGWGHTIFGGEMEPVLQEANVTVFEASRCDATYSDLRDYRDKFPNGITEDLLLCAGHEGGGADACQGDSGGPAVYETSFNGIQTYTLAGIVSTGFGCGKKGYPGLYIPINNPKYLSWIKKVAFAPKAN